MIIREYTKTRLIENWGACKIMDEDNSDETLIDPSLVTCMLLPLAICTLPLVGGVSD